MGDFNLGILGKPEVSKTFSPARSERRAGCDEMIWSKFCLMHALCRMVTRMGRGRLIGTNKMSIEILDTDGPIATLLEMSLLKSDSLHTCVPPTLTMKNCCNSNVKITSVGPRYTKMSKRKRRAVTTNTFGDDSVDLHEDWKLIDNHHYERKWVFLTLPQHSIL